AAPPQAEARHQPAGRAAPGARPAACRDGDAARVAIQSTPTLVAALERRVAALRRAGGLAVDRADDGFSDRLEVLDSDGGLCSAELAV
ncbi:hypothetical protein, partial [Stenotrophomonas sp. SrG]|uniref:hypothetical protein n=1 Tax=Stenotrophomonas sp. SrG TaxID=3414430 RepID=UPI003CE97712